LFSINKKLLQCSVAIIISVEAQNILIINYQIYSFSEIDLNFLSSSLTFLNGELEKQRQSRVPVRHRDRISRLSRSRSDGIKLSSENDGSEELRGPLDDLQPNLGDRLCVEERGLGKRDESLERLL
jgi:hypothetical protein